MKNDDYDKKVGQILSQLAPPHTLIVLTAMCTVESLIASRKRKMAHLVEAMDDVPSKEQRKAWKTELAELMKDYAMLTAMVVDAYESVLGITTKVESDEELLNRLGIDTSMLVPGPKDVQ